jgi:hypothetical protein
MRHLALALAVMLSLPVAAQEFKPHPQARIAQEQWQKYFEEVSSNHASSRQDIPSQLLVVFHDRATYTSYAFTQPGHAAHPAWVTRVVVRDDKGVNVRQISYFAGDEEPFAKLFRAYQQLNAQMRQDFERREREGQK